MGLTDILGADPYAAAAGASQTAQALAAAAPPPQAAAPAYGNDFPDLENRLAIAKAVLPGLENDPSNLMAAAKLNVPTEMLPQQLLQMNNVTRQADQVAYLGSLDPKIQSRIYDAMTDEQQRYLANIGWNPAGAGGGGGGFMGFVGKALHYGSQGVQWATGINEVRYAYRGATSLPGVGHPLERATHYTVGEVAHYGVGTPVRAVERVYRPVAAVPSHLVRTGNALDDMTGNAPWYRLDVGVKAWLSPDKVARAWHMTADGERYVISSARTEALDQVGGDQGLYTDLLNLQAGDPLDEIVARNHPELAPGTDEFASAVNDLYQRVNMPAARKAMQTIQRGKSSVGRDLARAVGLKPGTVEFTLASGVGDGLFSWYSDPAIVLGHALSATRVARYGLQLEEGVTEAQAIDARLKALRRFYGQALETTTSADGRIINVVDAAGKPVWEGGMRAGRSKPIFERANQLIADSFASGDTRAIKGAFPQQADMIQRLVEWDARYGIKTADDVAMFFSSVETQAAIFAGDVLDLAAKVPTLPYLSRTNQVTNAVKSGLRAGLIDLGQTNAWLRHGAQGLAELAAEHPDHPGLARLQRIADSYAARPDGPTKFARDLVGRWVAEPVAKAMESLVTHVPKGGVLDLANAKGVEQFDRVLRMGGYAHLPGPLQDVLFDIYARGNIQTRRHVYQQFLTDLANGLGIDAKQVSKLPEHASKFSQRYSLWSNDVFGDLRVALEPIQDTSTHIAIPRFRELLAASTLNNFTSRFFARTAEGLPGHFTDRIWAPLTLLRFAFIPRVVGDEAFAFVLRHGPRAYAEGLAAPLAYDPTRIWDPVNFVGRQLARAVPARLADAPLADRIGAWWADLQTRMAKPLGHTLEHFVGSTKLETYAGIHGDPLGRFPMSALANNPTIQTAWARVSMAHGHGFLTQEVDPKLNQVLAFTSGGGGPDAATHLVVPVSAGSRFQVLDRDLEWMKAGDNYAGNTIDAAIEEAAAAHYNRKFAGPVSGALARELQRYVTDADMKLVLKRMGTKRFSETVETLGNLPYHMQSDLWEALADNRPGAIESLGERWAAERKAGKRTRKLLEALSPLDARQRNILLAAAEHPARAIEGEAAKLHGLVTYSDPEFLRSRLRTRAREALDAPDLQHELMGMERYNDVGKTVPHGHVQLYSVNATPDALAALQDAAQQLGPRMWEAGPAASPRLRAALSELQAGFNTADLQALQARLQRTGLGSLPVTDWAHINPDAIDEVIDHLHDVAGQMVAAPEALDGLHVGYNHVRAKVLREAGAANLPLDILGANRTGRYSFRLGNASLAQTADLATTVGRTLEQAKDAHALALADEFMRTFTSPGTPVERVIDKEGTTITRWQGGSVHHEIINPGVREPGTGILVKHVRSMPSGYPTRMLAPEPLITGPGGVFRRIVDFGYGRVISPAIDALARQPMFLEYVSRAYEQARLGLLPFIYDRGLEATALGHTGGDLGELEKLGHDLRARFPRLQAGEVRGMDKAQWDDMLDRWLRNRGDELASAKAKIGDLPDFGALTGDEIARMPDGRFQAMPRRADGLDEAHQANVRLHAYLKGLEPEQAGDVFAWARHRDAVEQQLVDVAAENGVKSMIPYIHDHTERSQFQEFVRPFIPFQFAEEQFIKRWGRTMLYNPDAVGKAALTIGAMRDVGFIHRDQYGEEVYVVPGSQQFMDMLFRTLPHVLGMPAMVPVASALTGSINHSVPGFDLEARPFSFSPVASVPIKYLSQRFPEFTPTAEKILGARSFNQSITDMIVPSHVRRIYTAITADQGNKRFSQAMIQAMAQLQAGGHGVPQNATADQIEQFVSRARNQARVLLIGQALLGLASPAAPQVDYEGDLNPEFQTLLRSGMTIEDATSAFLQAHPDATPYTVFLTRVPSKAQLPADHAALNFLVDNRGFVDRYPQAGAWLLPQSTSKDGFEYAAYQQELAHGMRVRKTPNEWVRDVLFAEAAPVYFDSQDAYDRAVAGITNQAQRAQLTKSFQEWKASYQAMHPVFAEELASRGEASAQRRATVRRELTSALADPELPDAVQRDGIATMLASFDAYQTWQDSVAGDRRGATERQKKAVVSDFLNWGTLYSRDHPEVRAFWERIIKPDVGTTAQRTSLELTQGG